MAKRKTRSTNGRAKALPADVAHDESFTFEIAGKRLRATPCPEAMQRAWRRHKIGLEMGSKTVEAFLDALFIATAYNYDKLTLERWDRLVAKEQREHGTVRLLPASQKALIAFASIHSGIDLGNLEEIDFEEIDFEDAGADGEVGPTEPGALAALGAASPGD